MGRIGRFLSVGRENGASRGNFSGAFIAREPPGGGRVSRPGPVGHNAPMSERAAGYVMDVGYTFGYHRALNPRLARLALMRAGIRPPGIRVACELGFGQGVSLAVHAAASDIAWWGNDLLPAHVRHARALAASAGVGLMAIEASFAEFLEHPDLPRFDFIGLHGVLSWVSAENRACISEFIRRHLAVGGIVYTGCNALPGWNAMIPLRRLMADHAARAGGGDTVQRIDGALDFAGRLLESSPAHASQNPALAQRFERMRGADRRYLAHEYFNRDWHPMPFAELAGVLGDAGLTYACPAHLADHLDILRLTPDQRGILAGIGDSILRETVRDFMTNATFRQDLWMRDPVAAGGRELETLWRGERVVLLSPAGDLPERMSGSGGELRLSVPGAAAVTAALGDQRPCTVGGIEAISPGVPLATIADTVFELAASGHLASAAAPGEVERARPRTAALNARFAVEAEGADDIAVLASPVTGGGIPVSRAEQLFLAARAAGLTGPDAWAEAAARVLRTDGPAQEGLVQAARVFARRRLPVLQVLEVALPVAG